MNEEHTIVRCISPHDPANLQMRGPFKLVILKMGKHQNALTRSETTENGEPFNNVIDCLVDGHDHIDDMLNHDDSGSCRRI